MSKGPASQEEKKNSRRKPARKRSTQTEAARAASAGPLIDLQHTLGNRAVQRLIAQRSADSPSEVDDETAEQINRQRGSGQPLDSAMQERMSKSTGEDFHQVKVHTGPEADELNQKLGARAFTTGQDIYFRDGAYQPHSAAGQELLAHELTHVVQQRHGAVGSSSHMTVNAPGDAFEQQADAVSHANTSGQAAPGLQREQAPEGEETVQAKAEEEEMVQAQAEEEEEEEEVVQAQEVDDDEEAMKT
jgi:hypothetical protein